MAPTYTLTGPSLFTKYSSMYSEIHFSHSQLNKFILLSMGYSQAEHVHMHDDRPACQRLSVLGALTRNLTCQQTITLCMGRNWFCSAGKEESTCLHVHDQEAWRLHGQMQVHPIL